MALAEPADTGNLDAVPDRIYDATLTDEERNRWQELRGHPPDQPSLRKTLSDVMNRPDFKQASDVEQANIIHQIFTVYQEVGKAALIKERRELTQRIAQALQAKAAAMQPLAKRSFGIQVGQP